MSGGNVDDAWERDSSACLSSTHESLNTFGEGGGWGVA